MEINVRLRMVLSTLDGISVSGKDNLDRLLGSIQEIEKIVNVLENPVHSAPEKSEEGEIDG